MDKKIKIVSIVLIFIITIGVIVSLLRLNANSSRDLRRVGVVKDNNLIINNNSNSLDAKRLMPAVNDRCKEVIVGHNDLNGKRINIIFVGGGANSLQATSNFSFVNFFAAMINGGLANGYSYDPEIQKLYNYSGFSGVEPYASNMDKFNFWYVDIPLNTIAASDVLSVTDIYNRSELKNYCNYQNKFVHIVYKQDNLVSAPHRGSSGFSQQALVFEFDKTDDLYWGDFPQFIHEFTHSFAAVWDEKVTQPETINGPNCFSLGNKKNSAQECAKSDKLPWHDLIGNGCGKDGIVDCPMDTLKKNADRFDNWIYEVRDDVEGCGEGCKYSQGNIFRPFMLCNTMSSCDLGYDKYGISINGNIDKLGVINEREACRKIRSLVGEASAYCQKLCLDGCEFGKRCVQGSCVSKNDIK